MPLSYAFDIHLILSNANSKYKIQNVLLLLIILLLYIFFHFSMEQKYNCRTQ